MLEGRDIGTVVFPEADVKLFVTASDEVRAARRHAELMAKGLTTSLEEVLAEQRKRDHDDSTRELAPLKAAADATTLDTSQMALDEVIDRVVAMVEKRKG